MISVPHPVALDRSTLPLPEVGAGWIVCVAMFAQLQSRVLPTRILIFSWVDVKGGFLRFVKVSDEIILLRVSPNERNMSYMSMIVT